MPRSYSLGAALLFGESHLSVPDHPQCLLRMARFRGITKSEFEDDRLEIAGAGTLPPGIATEEPTKLHASQIHSDLTRSAVI